MKALATSCWVVNEEKTGTLEVIAEDRQGHSLQGAELQLKHLGSGKLRRTNSNTFIDIPYGAYELTVHTQGFRQSRGFINVGQAQTHSRFLLDVSLMTCEETGPSSLSGKVERNGDNRELWVKVISTRGLSAGEARVGPYGYFQVSGLTPAANIVMVLRGDEVLSTTTVRDFKNPVTIRLPATTN